MPFAKPFDAADGASHPDCYWTPILTSFDWFAEQARIVYAGFHDAAFWSQGGKPIDGAQREYLLAGDAFRSMAPAYLSGAIPPAAMVDQVAIDALDVPAPTAEDPGRMVSFFGPESGATQVPFPGMG